MGHIVLGWAMHFQVFNPLTIEMPAISKERLNWLGLTRAEIFSSNSELRDPTTRKCYHLRQTTLKRQNLPQEVEVKEEEEDEDEQE